jgi:hypothetical protein
VGSDIARYTFSDSHQIDQGAIVLQNGGAGKINDSATHRTTNGVALYALS